MNDFIFEMELENIKNNTTKEYLKEVITSFNLGNYRSAIVSLYNVVLCDLVFKLKTLSEVYEDLKANEILEKLGINNTDQKYAIWENTLVENIVSKTNLLDKQEEQLIKRLKEDRDHCAHLALKDFTLYSPNKDQTRAHIRNMFELVFLREPLLHKDIIVSILKDIETYYTTVGSLHPERFGHYLSTKYYTKLNEKVELNLFKTLWNFVFVKTGGEYDENRIACYYGLYYLVAIHPQKFLNYVKNDPSSYYGNIKMNDKESNYGIKSGTEKLSAIDINSISFPQAFLIYFLSEYKDFFAELKGHITEIMQHEAEQNINLLIRAIFLSKDFKNHLKGIKDYKGQVFNGFKDFNFYDYYVRDTSIDLEQMKFLALEAENRNCTSDLVEFVLKWLNEIGSYDSAYMVMENMIFPIFKYFNREDVERLAEIMDNNSQISGDTKNRYRYIPKLKHLIKEKYGADFAFEKY